VGYNIYRSTVSGGSYTKLNSALNTATSYVDKTVAAGTTYYYVATAVNSSGAESGYSAVVVAVVPTP
jgi:fibronectin type 3 domain-containing protein